MYIWTREGVGQNPRGIPSTSALHDAGLGEADLASRTARFVNQQLEKMVAVGMTGPRSVRLWMRTNDLRPHELQIVPFGDPHGAKTVRILMPPGSHGDSTFAFTYPDSFNARPLDPLRRYNYRIVQTSDGTPVGAGSFETAPAHDSDTPDRVVIAVMSCHQPFTSQGTVAKESARMLRLIPRILQENSVKFVLLCGDQKYADSPGDFSLFSNRYLIQRTCRGKASIFDCSVDEVRRAYDLRYRIFWSMIPMRKMYAHYPCYPAIDDHEILDDWGSRLDHRSPKYSNIWNGARLAYFDYQALRILRSTHLPRSFHYSFSYGNIGVFVMDIRSERVVGAPNQLYSDAQLADLSRFLRDNAHKKVLLIVCSVPVVHLPSWLAELGHAITGPDVDFLDHWSYDKNVPARTAFLTLLHQHQQAHPNQRVALVSGDVHVGCAFVINWQGGNKPRLYQFTSSAISNQFKGWKADISKVGPQLVSDIACSGPWRDVGGMWRERARGPCSGRVSLLSAVAGGGSQNPFTGLNLGLIEVRRYGDESNLKFKLIGSHPREERPVTYFESGWLG